MDALQPDDPVNVGPYRLVSRIGAGGMGKVYLGTSPGGRKVAVKVIHPDYARDSGFRERFAREVEAARRVGGFHTAQVVDADPFADPPWMVTAFIQGPSLEAAVLADGPFGPDEIRALGAGLAEGLAAIHACGLVHRDVKPSNVILGDDGPRIIDFGIARLAGAKTMTTAGAVFGTLDYMSPEQVKGEPAGPASDVFSFASTLVFAATGHSPFNGDTMAAVVYRVVTEQPDLTRLPEEAGFRRLVAACLAKNPADRPSLGEILAGLSGAGAPAGAARAGDLTVRPHGDVTAPAAGAAGAGAPDAAQDTVPSSPAHAATMPASSHGTTLPSGQRSSPLAPPAAGSDARPPRRRGRLSRRATVAAAVAAVAVAAAVAVPLTVGSPRSQQRSPSLSPTLSPSRSAGAPAHPVSLASIPVAAASALTPVDGDVYVEYQGAQDANATISGEIKDARSGQAVRLYAQRFPYTSAPATAGSLIVRPAGGVEKYAFTVTPAVATRYHVELFPNSTSGSALATSAATTIYVTIITERVGSPSCSARPVCHLTETHVFYVPPATLKAEMSRTWYAYLGLNLSSTGEPPDPSVEKLNNGNPVVGRPQLISADEFSVTIVYTFNIGLEGYHFASTVCAPDIEAQDGIGLPGSHGCGSAQIDRLGYLG